MAKTGVLLMNIGSPDSYQVPDVKRYLRRFLMDKDIISAPWFVRWPLVHIGIVPRRGSFSAGNYKKIWTDQGSPLLVYSRLFAEKLQTELGSNFVVQLGMRYSAPEISEALENFKKQNVEKVLAVPLYPQYAEATTGSSLKELHRVAQQTGFKIPIQTVGSFFDQDFFIEPSAQIALQESQENRPEYYLFSFHGLPKKQIQKKTGCLKNESGCTDSEECKTVCYRAHCFATANKLAIAMKLQPTQWSVSFQSRLGPVEWIRPYTDDVLKELAKSGVKNIAVLCPSFVADCIETLEEIGVGERESFLHAGGEKFTLISCVNDHPAWVQGFAQFLLKRN